MAVPSSWPKTPLVACSTFREPGASGLKMKPFPVVGIVRTVGRNPALPKTAWLKPLLVDILRWDMRNHSESFHGFLPNDCPLELTSLPFPMLRWEGIPPPKKKPFNMVTFHVVRLWVLSIRLVRGILRLHAAAGPPGLQQPGGHVLCRGRGLSCRSPSKSVSRVFPPVRF